ncbi:hypothetical protein ES703_113152 [subsurface metagenome]
MNPPTKPTVVTLCGSTKFDDAFTEAQLKETLAGKIVLTIGCNVKSGSEIFNSLSPEALRLTKAKLDILHLHKITLSDEILVLNVDGYIGESTEREIVYAKSIGVEVKYLEMEV